MNAFFLFNLLVIAVLTSSFQFATYCNVFRLEALQSTPVPYQPNVKDLLLADSCSGLSRSEINEFILEVIAQNMCSSVAS
jgi:hypothetical protein